MHRGRAVGSLGEDDTTMEASLGYQEQVSQYDMGPGGSSATSFSGILWTDAKGSTRGNVKLPKKMPGAPNPARVDAQLWGLWLLGAFFPHTCFCHRTSVEGQRVNSDQGG